MTTYESKLNVFANGKTLIRLAHQVRDRADARCDACGSTQPRILTGLRDPDSDRYFFVGDTCLKELMNRRAISRGYGRSSGPAAYDAEMMTRSAEFKEASADQAENRTASGESPETRMDSKPSQLSPMIAVVEAQDYYRAYVYFVTDEGVLISSGFAEESRYREVWQLGKDGDLLIERVFVECAEAFDRSVECAWREACAGLSDEQSRALPWKELPALKGKTPGEPRLDPVRIKRQTVVGSIDILPADTASAR